MPLTTPQWLLGHADALEWRREEGRVALHDSCHVTKKAGMPDPSRQLLSLMADVAEMTPDPQDCVCCGYYNIHVNHELTGGLHADKLTTVRKAGAEAMAVECVTCWEAYREAFEKAKVPLWELMVLAEQATRPQGDAS